MPISAMSLVILIAGVALSVAGMLLVRRLIPLEKLSENNDYVSFTFSILSLIYGIYLAFTVVVVWQQFEDAEATVANEVVLLATAWRSVEPFAPDDRQRIRGHLTDYTRGVIEEDYPRMERGLTSTFNEYYEQIWSDFYQIEFDSSDGRAAIYYGEALTRLNEFAIARRARILASNASLPRSMWVLLIIGAAGTIMFTWFYGTHYVSVQIAATTFLSAVIIYAVLLVAMLEYPFGSGVRVSDEPYREALERFEALEN